MSNRYVYKVGVSDVGKFIKTYIGIDGKRKDTCEYKLWRGMLERCYCCKYLAKYPTYVGCHVSENFKSFQYFAKWCQSQVGFMGEGYCLDKDILVKGNKLYGEETCVFIPRRINLFHTNSASFRGEYPIGVTKKINRFCARLNSKYIGTFYTPEEAFCAFKIAKEALGRSLALEYTDLVDNRVIEVLNNFSVSIDE